MSPLINVHFHAQSTFLKYENHNFSDTRNVFLTRIRQFFTNKLKFSQFVEIAEATYSKEIRELRPLKNLFCGVVNSNSNNTNYLII